jgi:hypothetical protein
MFTYITYVSFVQGSGDQNRTAESIYAKGKNVQTTIWVCSLTAAMTKDLLVGLL